MTRISIMKIASLMAMILIEMGWWLRTAIALMMNEDENDDGNDDANNDEEHFGGTGVSEAGKDANDGNSAECSGDAADGDTYAGGKSWYR